MALRASQTTKAEDLDGLKSKRLHDDLDVQRRISFQRTREVESVRQELDQLKADQVESLQKKLEVEAEKYRTEARAAVGEVARQAAEEANERIRQMSELVAAEKERLRACAEEHAEQVKVNLTKEAEAVIHRERLEKSQIASNLDEATRRLQQAEYERETLRQQASVEIN